jgi:pimeloyl-ACP methyl ester carboxylesterase
MAHPAQGLFEIDGGTLYYESAGTGPSLVLSHAAFLDSRMFDPQWDMLAQHFRVIRYDMRGFGRSSEAHGPVCRRDDLTRLLDHLDVEQAHLVGCSNGGQIMLDLALEQPHKVLSLTLIGSTPSGFELRGDMPRNMQAMFEALQSGDIDRANELQIRIWVDGAFREPDAVEPATREKALMMNRIPVERNTFVIADMQPVCPLDPPAVTRLGEIQCPALIAVGALDDPHLLHAADVLGESIAKAHKHVIDAAGHVPSFEKPQAFNPVLLDFLRSTAIAG